jgi:L-fuculose-phosphate aldolase
MQKVHKKMTGKKITNLPFIPHSSSNTGGVEASLIDVGKRLVAAGLTYSRMGNISARAGDMMLISATGSFLDRLKGEIVKVPLDAGEPPSRASSDALIHLGIYLRTEARGIVHTHSPFLVALSALIRAHAFRPLDIEGRYYLGEIPIVSGATGSRNLARALARELQTHPCAVVRFHGAFARGESLYDAFHYVACAEHSCMVKYLVLLAQRTKKR